MEGLVQETHDARQARPAESGGPERGGFTAPRGAGDRAANAALNRQEALQGKRVLRSMPTYAWLALTSRCNLKCLHCPRDPLTAPEIDLEGSRLRGLLRRLFPTLEHVTLGGNNLAEQFLSSEVETVVDEAAAHGVELAVTTNGTILRREVVRKLVAADAVIRLSVEGVGAAFEAVREARWSRIERFVAEINRARAAMPSSRAQIMLGFTAFAENLGQLPEVIRFAAANGVSSVHVQHFMPVHSNQRLQSLIYHRSLANRAFAEAKQLADSLGIAIDLPVPFQTGSMEKVDAPRAERGALSPCYYPWARINVLENGDVVPCCIANSMIMGNLHEQSFEEIWNGKPYQRLRATVNSDKPLGVCASCSMRAGNDNDPEALMNLVDSQGLEGMLKQRLKELLIRHNRKDVLKQLVLVRDRVNRFRSRMGA